MFKCNHKVTVTIYSELFCDYTLGISPVSVCDFS